MIQTKSDKDFRVFDEINSTGMALSLYTAGACDHYMYNTEDSVGLYEKFAERLGTDAAHMIRPEQRHTDLVVKVGPENAGEGVVRPGKVQHDAIITNTPGLVITVATADCLPVSVLDPVKKAIGIIHSGWEGTRKGISRKTVEKMIEEYGTDPKDLICCVGPHICEDCYEVGAELIDFFLEEYSEEECRILFSPREDGKYLLNLGLGVKLTLMKAGVQAENIHIPDLCTFHTEDYSSWRRTRSLTERILSGIMLK